jgi:hypothetical protein
MWLLRTSGRLGGALTRVSVAVCLSLLLLAVGALACSPSLHQLVHSDAGDENHCCAVTAFAHGQAEGPALSITLTAPPLVPESPLGITISVPAFLLTLLPDGRAPPVYA